MKPAYSPLVETVFGVSFSALEKFRSPHCGLFWELIRESYPLFQEAPPLTPPAGSSQVITFSSIPPLPRLWFINNDNDRLIQIQPDRFISNWKRRTISEEYVGYQACKANFIETFKMFREFLVKENLGTIETGQLELSYINHIPQNLVCSDMEQIREVISLLDFTAWAKDGKLALPKQFSCQFQVEVPYNLGELIIKTSTVRKVDNPEPLLHISLTFLGQSTDMTTSGVDRWFDDAHEWILKGFKGLTSKKIRESFWKPAS